MCAIAGLANVDQPGLIEKMCQIQAHRGPDDQGVYRFGAVALGHRRLSIIDLSSAGHQPMSNEDGTLWITYNGEIYNYAELAGELSAKGHRFKSRCDTEVLLHAYEEWGLSFIDRLNGMFAFCIFDQPRNELLLVRDRLGIKPLYYWQEGSSLLFASEMKAILEADRVTRSPNLALIPDYLSQRYVPGPDCLIEGIHKLPAGHLAVFRDGQLDVRQYWDPEIYDGPYGGDDDYQEEFGQLLDESVRMRLRSDVRFGAYLSGGLDSSINVALMSQQLDTPVKTFSAGFGFDKDELPIAQGVADHFGCEHQEVICRSGDIGLLPKIIWHLDEPQGDAIILPTYLLSQAARKDVSMVISGEGADETMAGYQFHQVIYRSMVYRKAMPKVLHDRILMPMMRGIPARTMDMAFSHPGALDEKGKQRLVSYCENIYDASIEKRYRQLTALFDQSDIRDLGIDVPGNSHQASPAGRSLENILNLQFSNWLPNNILWRQDRLTMANSIEGRVPFLDHRLVEFLLRVPRHLKIRGLTGKYLLRKHGDRILPRHIVRRKKQPFYIPLDRYVQHRNFQDLIQRTLTPELVKQRGLMDWPAVRALLSKVENRDFLHAKQLMSLVALEIWFQIYVDGRKDNWALA